MMILYLQNYTGVALLENVITLE